MPCLIWRILESLASRAVISASMPERMVAMALCSVSSAGCSISNFSTSVELTESKVEPFESFAQVGSLETRA